MDELKENQKAIDMLKPKSDAHEKVKAYLLKRLTASERKMAEMYPRWRINELKIQAYVELNDYEQLLKNLTNSGKPASPVSITVPFVFSTIQTIVTYLFNTFGGRNPIFAIGSTNATQADRVQGAELLLQYNADHTKFLKHLYQFLLDDEVYGVGIMRMMWKTETRKVSKIVQPDELELAITANLGLQNPGPRREVSDTVVFEGSDVATIDPYLFFPDPRVPMVDLNLKGEFVFWRAYESLHILKQQEDNGVLKYVADANKALPQGEFQTASGRGLRAGMSNDNMRESSLKNFYQVDQGVCWISPKELGLGPETKQEMWLFTILNKDQIVQAEPVEFYHGRLPVEVCEGSSLGYTFGSLGTADYLAPLQDTMSWLINSHIYNVRSTMNNNLIVDPMKVVMEDLQDPEPGKIIRLRNQIFGQGDARSAVYQLPIQDVTRGHLNDFEQFARFGAEITGASENLRGISSAGGRKTATEIRVSGEAGSSRLAAKARLISAQAMVGIAEQLLCNYQQFMTIEHEFKVLGDTGQASLRVTPETINDTNFNFPIHDGTLPMDKFAMVDLWKEILQTVLTEPTGAIRNNYDIGRIFEWIAQLGGAQNISSFRIKGADPAQIDAQVQQGNLIPLSALGGMQ